MHRSITSARTRVRRRGRGRASMTSRLSMTKLLQGLRSSRTGFLLLAGIRCHSAHHCSLSVHHPRRSSALLKGKPHLGIRISVSRCKFGSREKARWSYLLSFYFVHVQKLMYCGQGFYFQKFNFTRGW